MKIRSAAEVFEYLRAKDPLRDFFVSWDRIESNDVEAFQLALDEARREEDIQQFLQENPKCLIQHLGGGHGRWVIPKQKLGSEHVTDFVIGERDSLGFHWQAVELESPLKPMFNKNGDPSQYLNHAIRQISDWRGWLNLNQNYAARDRADSGLGLKDISTNVQGLIVIGRRTAGLEKTAQLRRQLVSQLNIKIHTYDFLIDTLAGRVESLKSHQTIKKSV